LHVISSTWAEIARYFFNASNSAAFDSSDTLLKLLFISRWFNKNPRW